ncbi:selenoprotein W family protein [Zalerion maritima]|uniref:Selenoprotein W family protein n=1 Tax=Zalerion maritima TaxID=339359 RepID=A0AAD5RYQ9_9PEZI|nr:selenoprotein W family protein [Zalerion maritima]
MSTTGQERGVGGAVPAAANTTTNPTTTHPFPLPRVTIQFCTQCKWMLRAAYYAQELLSTFSTSIGEVSLQPTTGGIFVVSIVTAADIDLLGAEVGSTTSKIIWDRKTDGGFPETKELKRKVRDVIDPGRNLGHVDKDYAKPAAEADIGGRSKPTQPMAPRWGSMSAASGSGSAVSAPVGAITIEGSVATSPGTSTSAVGKEENKDLLASHLKSSGAGRAVKLPPGNDEVKAKIEAAAAASSPTAGKGDAGGEKCVGEVCEDC